jgi:putative Holliday junction resolvase
MLIGEADLTRARRAAVVDKAAAAWMLQAALDATRPG